MANLNTTQTAELRVEIDTDPLGRGYAAMTDTQIASRVLVSGINTVNIESSQAIPIDEFENAIRFAGKLEVFQSRARPLKPIDMGPPVVEEHYNPAMFELMSAFEGRLTDVNLRDAYWTLLIDTAVAEGALGSGAAEQIKALSDVFISRATQLEFPTVTTDDVSNARALP